jgi:alpha-1,2-mannosyltransferase
MEPRKPPAMNDDTSGMAAVASGTAPDVRRPKVALLGRPATLGGRLALIAVSLTCVALFVAFPHGHGMAFGPYRIDLDVYRIGSRAWLDGVNLYGRLPTTMSGAKLPFTYPPMAAVILAPLALMPMTVASVGLTVVSAGLLALVLRLCLRSMSGPAGQSSAWAGRAGWAVWWLLPPALLLEPVRNDLAYGQVNIVLMALVALDCLTPAAATRWPRGCLIGIAAAVKLTPAAFVLYFVVRRDWRAAGTAAASFLVATGAGFLMAWHDSVEYWTKTVFDVSRIGGLAYAANQSTLGVLDRLGISHSAATLAWAAAAVIVVSAAWRGMTRALAADQHCLALSLNALAALLASPVSWSHQWVWCVPALLALADATLRQRAAGLATATVLGIVLFFAGPQWWFPRGDLRELAWSGWEQAVGSAYVLFAAAILLYAAVGMPGLAASPSHRAVPSVT